MAAVDLPSGTLHHHQCGSGAPIVFLHGYLMGANLWDPVIHLLDHEFRCITPELPLGAHPTPMRPDADLTTAGLGAWSPTSSRPWTYARSPWSATTAAAPSPRSSPPATPSGSAGWCWPAAMRSTTPPKLFRPLIAAARMGALTPMLASLKARPARSLPSAYGWLTHRQSPHEHKAEQTATGGT